MLNQITVVAGVIESNGKILATQRSATGSAANLWEFPGGKVEPGEDPEAALCRELREELSISVEIEGYLGEFTEEVDGKLIRLMCYWARWTAGEMHLHIHQAAQWCSVDELSALPFAAPDIPAIQKITQIYEQGSQSI